MNLPETKSFGSHAKLMISGEYLVLKGALSLAVPLRFEQKLMVHETKGSAAVVWESMINDCLWFYATITLPDFRITDTNFPALSETLRRILLAAKELNPLFLVKNNEYHVISEMDFEPDWGIGSSSSLISNIAYWAACDPYQLNFQVFNGSGYDIACARASSPIIYELLDNQPNIRQANFNPSFDHQLYFVYLNRKQSTKEGIHNLDYAVIKAEEIRAISDLTLEIEKVSELPAFRSLIDRHEEIIAKIIRQQTVKKHLFNDFNGSLKSLGAWGGDFILAASPAPEEYVRDYFKYKNYETIFRYNDVVMNV